ncbi:MAG: hypothetical protein AAGC81_15360 [Pseudomonadota bacterium]
MTHEIRDLSDDELETLVGGRAAQLAGGGDDDSNGGLLIPPDGPSANTNTTHTGQFKIKRTNTTG